MAINALQPILRVATGKELQFTWDFHAYWDQLGIPPMRAGAGGSFGSSTPAAG